MTFRQHDSITFLNLPFEDDANDSSNTSALDDLFLNFPSEFTFEDDFNTHIGQDRGDQATTDAILSSEFSSLYGEKQADLDMSAQYTLQTLPRSATMGPNKLAATPSTALALLQRKQQYAGKGVSSLSMPPLKEKRDADAMLAAQFEGEFVFDSPVLDEPTPKRPRVAPGTPGTSPEQLESHDISSTDGAAGMFGAASNQPPADKRLRNNQASARFRAKKKMREMQVENTARDAIIRAEILERRVKEMEMEVIWLRGLATSGLGDIGKSGKTEEAGRSTLKSLKQVYEENGVMWRDGSLHVTGNSPAVSGGPLPPPSWGVTEEGEIFALPVGNASAVAPSPALAGVPIGLPVQLALPTPAKRGRPPKKLVNVPNVPQPVATLGKVGSVIVGGVNVGLLPLLMQPGCIASPAKP